MDSSVSRRVAACLTLICCPASLNGGEPQVAFKRPELVAVTWAPAGDGQFQGAPPAAWRSDGTFLPVEELDWLFESGNFKTRHSRSRIPPAPLKPHPLVLVFRLDDRAKRPQRLNASLLMDGKPLITHEPISDLSHATETKDHLIAFRVLPPPIFVEWPPDVTFEVRSQVGDADLLYALDAEKAKTYTAEKPLQVDKGVTWRIEQDKPQANGRAGKCLLVLSVDHAVADAECEWLAEGTLQSEGLTRISQINQNGSCAEYISEVFQGDSLTRVELVRRRYRSQQYQQVPTHPELVPK
jgi:hypothetical protein